MKFKARTPAILIGIAGLLNSAGAALPPDYQGIPFDDAAYRAGQQTTSGEKTLQPTPFTPVKVLWDGLKSTTGEGWVGKGEDAASIILAPADQEGKRLIHYHNKADRVNFSTFGWRWAGPQEAPVDLRQYDAVSFAIRITGPQKPQELFFGINGANPTPVSLRKYEPRFADGSWHTITIPLRDLHWSAHRPITDMTEVRGCSFMTFLWKNSDYDIHLDHFTCDRGPAQPAGIQEDRSGCDRKPSSRRQAIPGRVECAFYDAGGEGVAYHDTDPINVLSGILNQTKEHQPAKDASPYHWNFRVEEGVDISFTKTPSDLKHGKNKVAPALSQLYIGAANDGEWCNYTVDVKKAGTYKIIGMYGNGTGTLSFSINHKPAGECKFPFTTGGPHKWNKAEVGTITFPDAGQQLLTLHYCRGNNLAYFDFELVEEK
jgi:Carbohydrate binding module (family 6)